MFYLRMCSPPPLRVFNMSAPSNNNFLQHVQYSYLTWGSVVLKLNMFQLSSLFPIFQYEAMFSTRMPIEFTLCRTRARYLLTYALKSFFEEMENNFYILRFDKNKLMLLLVKVLVMLKKSS